MLLACLFLLVEARDLYRDLGLKRSATQADIKAAYRDLAKRFHPDKNKEAGAGDRFKRIAAAHETLGDPDKRRLYDMYGDDYENVQKQRSQQQQQYRRQDFDPFGRRRPQVPPIFSVTMTLTRLVSDCCIGPGWMARHLALLAPWPQTPT